MKKNIYGGKFGVFEGIDGSGLSTQANLLNNFLSEKGFKVLLTKEPTQDSAAGRKVRKILDKKIKANSKTLQELFTEDRKEHLKNTIIPALRNAKIVISDRYFFSTFAYGGADGLDLDWLIKINSKFLLPDLTFILKVRPEICLQRIQKRGKSRTLFEKKEKLGKTLEIYQSLPKRFEKVCPEPFDKKVCGVYIIEGEKSIKEVAKEIQKIVLSKLNF